MLAAYDVISRVFSQKAVVNAYYNTNPDTFSIRDDDDPIRMIQKNEKSPCNGAQYVFVQTFVLENVNLYTLLNKRN